MSGASYATKDGFKRITKAINKNWNPTDKESASQKATIMSILAEQSRRADEHIDASQPPNIEVASKFGCEKWGDDYARNALLHYVKAKGLEKDCLAWVDAHFPDERYNDEE